MAVEEVEVKLNSSLDDIVAPEADPVTVREFAGTGSTVEAVLPVVTPGMMLDDSAAARAATMSSRLELV